MIDALRGTSSQPILNFPYQTHIAILLHRQLVAPVLGAYSASTPALQRYYVESLQRVPNLDVTYSVDGIASWPVDGVQTISRLPAIFDYFYENFQLRAYANGVMVMQPGRDLGRGTLSPLAFQPAASPPSSVLVRLASPHNLRPRAAATANPLPLPSAISQTGAAQVGGTQ